MISEAWGVRSEEKTRGLRFVNRFSALSMRGGDFAPYSAYRMLLPLSPHTSLLTH